MNMQPIRLMMVEDLERVRVALRTLLQAEPEFEVVGEAADGETALQVVAEQNPDLILMDLGLPGLSGLETIAALRKRGCAALIVCLTLHAELRAEAEAAGASLFLEKGICPEDLLAALRTASSPLLPPPPQHPPFASGLTSCY
jgi:DNA-binding NarL/FixJ family response regulator